MKISFAKTITTALIATLINFSPVKGFDVEEFMMGREAAEEFKKANDKIKYKQQPIGSKHKENPFAKIPWKFPTMKRGFNPKSLFGLRKSYTLSEVKDMTKENMFRMLDVPLLGDRNIEPKWLEIRRSSPGFRIDLTDWRKNSLQLLDIDKDHFQGGEQFVSYLRDAGIMDDKDVTYLLYTTNYDNFVTAFDLMCTPKDTVKEYREVLADLNKYSKMVLKYRTELLNGLTSYKEAVKLDTIPKGKVNRVFEHWLAEYDKKCYKSNLHKGNYKIRNKVLTKQMTLEKIAKLINAEHSYQLRIHLGELRPSHAIAFAQYFARSRIMIPSISEAVNSDYDIDAYFSDSKGRVHRDNDGHYIVGSSEMFSKMALYVLQDIIKPVNMNLKGWYFGVKNEEMVNKKRIYCLTATKIYEQDNETKMSTFFFDPYKLGFHPFANLTFNKILKTTDAIKDRRHHVKVKRYMEDMLFER